MKILHTSDWHLGRMLHEHSLLEDQAFFLDKLLTRIADEQYNAVIIAGDIYDRAVPNPEAVELFSNFLSAFRKQCAKTKLCILAGNHDSPQRLGFGADVLKDMDIHISVDPNNLNNFIEVSSTERTAHIYMLPYLFPGDYTAQGLSHEDVVKRSLKEAVSGLNTEVSNILVAHLFTHGAISSDSERTFVGTAGYVPPDIFSDFDYVALGHLHKPQRVRDNVYYSGSPIKYSFSEVKDVKSCLELQINKEGEITVEPIQFPEYRGMKCLEGRFEEFDIPDHGDNKAYVDITLLDEVLIPNAMQRLQARFPWLLNLKQGLVFDTVLNSNRTGLAESNSVIDDFEIFYKHLFDEEVDEDIKSLVSRELQELEVGE